MNWEEVDLTLTEAGEFSTDARRLVLTVFEISHKQLETEWAVFERRLHVRAEQETDEIERGFVYQEIDWEADLHRQRLQGIGLLVRKSSARSPARNDL